MRDNVATIGTARYMAIASGCATTVTRKTSSKEQPVEANKESYKEEVEKSNSGR